MSYLVITLYLLIGFIWARIGIKLNHELIWEDTGVHCIFLTLFWPLMIVVFILWVSIGFLQEGIDYIIDRLF